MGKFSKRMVALALTAAVAISTVTSAFAASSPTTGNTTDDTITTTPAATAGESTLTNATSKDNTLYVADTDDKNNIISTIAKNAVSDKQYDSVTFEVYSRTVFKANAVSGAAKKSKVIYIKRGKFAKKLLAKRFNKKAFKGVKAKIVVDKSSMSKKQFKKLKAKLKKGGFKGKIVRKTVAY